MLNKQAARLSFVLAGMLIAVFAAHAAGTVQPQSSYFHKAKITVNERAQADGFLRVRVQSKNGEGHEATIAVTKHMSENKIAKTLAQALETALGSEYKVDRDAGEHVKIRKANRSAPDFSVEIDFNVPGFSIVLDD
ncbi:MAG TPA: hypothetical protein VFY39_09810 [Gammaproteobacteria bacterium]|nr:hypothetical protein [Gammaproteobacteria bacterium]